MEKGSPDQVDSYGAHHYCRSSSQQSAGLPQ